MIQNLPTQVYTFFFFFVFLVAHLLVAARFHKFRRIDAAVREQAHSRPLRWQHHLLVEYNAVAERVARRKGKRGRRVSMIRPVIWWILDFTPRSGTKRSANSNALFSLDVLPPGLPIRLLEGKFVLSSTTKTYSPRVINEPMVFNFYRFSQQNRHRENDA